jgi:hypothetical protein
MDGWIDIHNVYGRTVWSHHDMKKTSSWERYEQRKDPFGIILFSVTDPWWSVGKFCSLMVLILVKVGLCLNSHFFWPACFFDLPQWVETQRYEYTKLQRSSERCGKSSDQGCEPFFKTEEDLEEEKTSEEPPPGDGGTEEFNPSPSGHEQEVSDSTSNSNRRNYGISNEKPAPATRSSSSPRLTEDRLRRLESIGFEWKVKHKMRRYYDKQWDQMFERLLAFKASTTHCMVPKRYPPDVKLYVP